MNTASIACPLCGKDVLAIDGRIYKHKFAQFWCEASGMEHRTEPPETDTEREPNMAVTADPFADPDTDAPKREAAERPSTFLTTQDLIGRHLIIVPKSIEWKQGDRDKYESVTADVIVLDGRKTEKIPSLPHIERNKFLGGWALVAELRPHVPDSGKPQAGKPVIGYLELDGKAYKLDKADAEIKNAPATLKAYEQYQNGAQNQEPPF